MMKQFIFGVAVGFVLACAFIWQSPLAAQSSFFRLPSFYHSATRVVITTATVAVTDSRVEANGGGSNYTITLPALANVPVGKEYNIKQLGTGVVTIDGNAAETIDGASSATLPGQYYSMTIYKCAALVQWCIQ